MTQPVGIHLRQCSRTFAQGHVALHPLDLDIYPGETLVLLGPSGCGKTTTLRIISGLESPDPGGEVWFDDRDVTALPIEKRNMGMVFQSYALFPNLNVAQNVAYGLKIHRLHYRIVKPLLVAKKTLNGEIRARAFKEDVVVLTGIPPILKA